MVTFNFIPAYTEVPVPTAQVLPLRQFIFQKRSGSNEQLILSPLSTVENQVQVGTENVDISTPLIFDITTDNLIDGNGDDSGAPLAAFDQNYFAYLSNSTASLPNQLRLSSFSPLISGGYLNANEDWLHVGMVYVKAVDLIAETWYVSSVANGDKVIHTFLLAADVPFLAPALGYVLAHTLENISLMPQQKMFMDVRGIQSTLSAAETNHSQAMKIIVNMPAAVTIGETYIEKDIVLPDPATSQLQISYMVHNSTANTYLNVEQELYLLATDNSDTSLTLVAGTNFIFFIV